MLAMWQLSNRCRATPSWLEALFHGNRLIRHAVTLPSTKAEHYALMDEAKGGKWPGNPRRHRIRWEDIHPVMSHEIHTGALALAENPEYHGRAKRIDIRMYYVRWNVENGLSS
jgi:hypothetical protein